MKVIPLSKAKARLKPLRADMPERAGDHHGQRPTLVSVGTADGRGRLDRPAPRAQPGISAPAQGTASGTNRADRRGQETVVTAAVITGSLGCLIRQQTACLSENCPL